MLRIISGKLRGKKLLAPPTITRPTLNRVRETLFNTLNSIKPIHSFTHCVDAFAGSGALGLEAHSRGAQFISFIEQDCAVCKTLSQNISFLEPSTYKLYQSDTLKVLPSLKNIDLLFLDPPYSKNLVNTILSLDLAFTPEALVVIECDKKDQIDTKEYSLLKEKTIGRVKLLYLVPNFS